MLEEKFLALSLEGGITRNTMEKLWKLIIDSCDEVATCKKAGLIPKSFTAFKRKAVKNLECSVAVDFKFREKATGCLKSVRDSKKISTKDFSLGCFTKVSETSRISVRLKDFKM